MLTDDQKSEIRRHLRWPDVSRGHLPYPFGQTELFHYSQASTFLEERLDLLVPITEAKLTGDVVGVLAFVGSEPTNGAAFSITVSSADLVSPVTIGPINFGSGDTLISMASQLPQLVAMNASLATAQITAGGPYGPGMAGQDIPLPQVTFKAPRAFTLAIASLTGIGVVIQQQGSHVDPRFDGATASCDSFSNQSGTIYGYLPILATLESLVLGSSARAQIARSGEFVRGDELNERRRLYNIYCQKLATFLGVEMGESGGYSSSLAL